MARYFYGMFFVVTTLLVGCAKKRPQVALATRTDLQTCQARLGDIALPISVKPVASSISATTYAYRTKRLVRSELIDFYTNEMERLGWALLGGTYADEVTLLFDKPHKSCVISIRGAPEQGHLVRIDVVHKQLRNRLP